MLAVDWESTVLPELRLFASIIPELVLQSVFAQRIQRSLSIPLALANLYPLLRYRPHLLHKPLPPTPPQPDSLLFCSLQFTLPSSTYCSLPPSKLKLLHVLKRHTSQPCVNPSLECSHSIFSEHTCVPASSVGILRCGHIKSQSTHTVWIYSIWPKYVRLRKKDR